ncbi:MAG: hypothetical protein WCW54_03800 [Candidatus Paceibacterota bacterium]
MNSQTKVCQNCKKDFTIEPDDFSFYEKMKVPPPTFCPECRLQRRMAWRNERSLFKRNCDLCKKGMISIYPRDAIFPVYCIQCWYSDKWDATDYSLNYDFSKPFFKQWEELYRIVPKIGVWQRNAINSDYSNMCGECRNVYLSVSVVLGSENIFYSRGVDKSFNIYDSYNTKESDSCFECIQGEKNYNSEYLLLSRNCLDSYFLVDCSNCSNCILSSNLRNKEFYFCNKKYSKEEYFKELEKLNLGSHQSREILIGKFENLCRKAIYRYADIIKSVDSTGNDIHNSKNCVNCFDVYNTENAKYCFRLINNKDSMDVDYAGKAELLYEYSTGALNDYNIKFSYSAMDAVSNADYTESCVSSKNLFGCISVKNKENVILNKVYTKEEYEKLIPKIKQHMNDMPYVDKRGLVYKYGEFFPIELSSFAYNETLAQDVFPLSKEKAEDNGYKWRDLDDKNYTITLLNKDIKDNIKDVDESILKETIECLHKGECDHKCMTAFRLTPDEFNFYKKHNIPIPTKCSNCRYYERFSKVLPLKLWHRGCMKEGCNNEFETPYAPNRPEIVYCEKCYQNEVY